MARVVIVSSDSQVLTHPSTQRLHIYENGDHLIQTDAPIFEGGASDEILVDQGLMLPQDETVRLNAVSDLTEVGPTALVCAYIELLGPVDARWLKTLSDLGLELLQYQPQNSYFCRGSIAAFEQARRQFFVRDVVGLNQIHKPRQILPEAGDATVLVVLQGSPEEQVSLKQEINELPGVTVAADQEIDAVNFYLRFQATVSAEGQSALLQHPRVLAVEPYRLPEAEDEVAGLIIAGQYDLMGRPNGSYLKWLESHGLNGAEVTIGIVDGGVDRHHPGFGDRTKDLSHGKQSWHGTFVAGHAVGCYLDERDGNQFIYGLGMAPKANVLIQDNRRSATALAKETVTEDVTGIKGTIQNNSWGMGTANPMTYSSLEATYDKLVRAADPDRPEASPLAICFSSGNSGPAGLTRPKAAKNLIVTGNSENFRPDVGKDQSDNIKEVYTGPRGSSHGNCGDGRVVPHVVAPGEWTASSNFGARPGEQEYISPHLTWGGGSSGASPKTAGACALLTQWWQRFNQQAIPSPAMLKALIVNGAEPMQSGGAIPNPIQGWGRLNLDNILDPSLQRIYFDQSQRLTYRGEQMVWHLRVADPHKPLKITLCWTDPPGALGSGTNRSPAVVNKLALRLQMDSQLYRANQFKNGWSYADGSADQEGWDNLQNIFLPPGGAAARLQISVTALDLTTDCLTGKVVPPQQDFALVITNGVLDQVDTPTSVFVTTDEIASFTVPPATADNFWHTDDRDADHKELDKDWWYTVDQSIGKTTGDHASEIKKPSGTSADAANLWWLQETPWWKANETERTLAVDLTAIMPAAIAAVNADDGQQVWLTQPKIDESGAGSSTLTNTLAQLTARWQLSTGRRVAVLVVRAHTRFRRRDLSAIRHLAFLGDLYLVSDAPQILTFLAQRIVTPNLHLRLATSALDLPTLCHSTVLEASGAQQLDVSSMSETTLAGAITHHFFQVVSVDQRFTIQLQSSHQNISRLELVRPDQSVLTIDATSPLVKILPQSAGLQITLRATQHSSWAGQWKLRLQFQPAAPVSPTPHIWAWSGLHWQMHTQPTTTSKNYLVTLWAEGAQLQRLQGQPQMVYGAEPQSETQRTLDISINLPRAAEVTAESSRTVSAPTISTLIALSAGPGAVAVDLPLRVEGIDSQGYPFVRFIRRSLVQRERSTVWRQRLSQQNTLLFVTARIADIHTQGKTVVALTLVDQERSRRVEVKSSRLQTYLSYALTHRFPDKPLVFGVIGDELCGLYCPLGTAPATKMLSFISQES